MTVVAIRGNVIAADSGTWEDDALVMTTAVKVIRCRHGAFVVCGWCVSASVKKQFETSDEIPLKLELPENSTVVLLANDLSIRFYQDGMEHDPFRPEYYAFGQAAPVALGAMAAGATAEQAIEAAIKHGPWAAGHVMAMAVGEAVPDDEAPSESGDFVQSILAADGFDPLHPAFSEVRTPPEQEDWRKRRGLR